VRITDRNDSERAIVALDVDGTEYVLRSDSLRWVLRPRAGPALLNSSYLRDIRVRAAGGEVDHLEIDGHGWGHGIGMCQVGAMGRARDGQSYHDILKAYYRGVEVERLY
jgi:stage II sporulation protein D